MRLEDVTAEIRPRVPWESIDLGCALAREHFGMIMKAWAVTVFPLWIVLAMLLHAHPFWFIFCVWWLKPLYDRVPLLVVSRALFGAKLTVREVLRAWPKLLVKRLWFSLLVGRFSAARSLTLPVAELEGLRGKVYKLRVGVLERNGGEGATTATVSAMILELVTACGLVMFVFLMVPREMGSRWSLGISDYFTYHNVNDIPDGFFWLMALVQMAAITLMEPFYVSAGFALYINSRTLTEGWDIELAFKRIGARLRNGKISMLLLVLSFSFLGSLASPLRAETSPDSSKESIREILKDEKFKVNYRYVDVPVKRERKEWRGFPGLREFFGVFGVVLFYVVVIAAVIGLAWLIYINRHLLKGWGHKEKKMTKPKTIAVMGMDVRPDSLPENIEEAARNAWREGKVRLALSLLYRGAIVWMIYHAGVAIESGDTEGDCLERVKVLEDREKVNYFYDLTQLWVAVAYGKREISEESMRGLCDGWPYRSELSKKERSQG